jgi:hypothetical protein
VKSLLHVLGSLRGGKIFWLRWILAVMAILSHRRVLSLEGGMIAEQFSSSLFGVGLVVIAGLLIAPEVLWAVLSVFNWGIGMAFMPSEEMRPPLDYRVARMYLKQLRFEDAVERYELLSHYHPQALDAYLEGMEAAFLGGFEDAARAFLHRGLSSLREREARAALQMHFDRWTRDLQD